MSIFTKTHTVELPKEIIDKANLFAKDVVDTTNYSDGNQDDKNKIINDHFVSILGEEAVKEFLEENGRDVIGPDYEIFGPNQKSWDSDLFVNDIGLAVKTQSRSLANIFGLSWTFQNIPGGRSDPVLSQPEAWVYFVEYIDTDRQKNKLLVYPPKQIKDLEFEEPVKDSLKGKKLVVYESSFQR